MPKELKESVKTMYHQKRISIKYINHSKEQKRNFSVKIYNNQKEKLNR